MIMQDLTPYLHARGADAGEAVAVGFGDVGGDGAVEVLFGAVAARVVGIAR